MEVLQLLMHADNIMFVCRTEQEAASPHIVITLYCGHYLRKKGGLQ